MEDKISTSTGEKLWGRVMEVLNKELSKSPLIKSYFDSLILVDCSETEIRLATTNKIVYEAMTERFAETVKRAIEKANGNGIKPVFLKLEKKDSPPVVEEDSPAEKTDRPPQPPMRTGYQTSMFDGQGRVGLSLQKDMTFDNFFVSGEEEKSIKQFLKVFAEGVILDLYMALITGDVGSGKSHLLHAVGRYFLEHEGVPRDKLIINTAEEFLNDWTATFKPGTTTEFQSRYRNCQVLLLDNIDFLITTNKAQDEIAKTLESLLSKKAKIILTSSIPTAKLRLKPKLRSIIELASPLVIEPINEGIIRRIVADRIETSSLKNIISKGAIDKISSGRWPCVRGIIGLINTLKMKYEVNKKLPDDSEIARLINYLGGEGEEKPTAERIEKIVCKYFKLEPQVLRSKSRKKIHALPRNIYVFFCRKYTELTLEEIGKTINRNHSTALYAVEVVAHKMKCDSKLKLQIEFLEEKIKKEI